MKNIFFFSQFSQEDAWVYFNANFILFFSRALEKANQKH
jgi:hypothetical protein